MREAGRIYVRDFSLAMIAYAVAMVGSIYLLRLLADSPWRYLVALIPVLPALYGLSVLSRFVDRIDEMQQRIQLRATAFACGVTAVVTFSYGLLEGVGLPHLNWTFVMPIIVVSWGLGAAWHQRRYR